MKKSVKIVFAAVLAIAAAAALYQLVIVNGNGGAAASEDLRAVTITRGNIENIVTAQGKLEPKEYVDVGAQVSGQLETLHVDIGDTVESGDLIAEIDAEVYRSEVAGFEARLKTLQAQKAEQEAQVEQARNKLQRNETLIKSKAVSTEAVEDTATALKIAEAKLVSLDAQIEEATSTLEGKRANLNYTRIFAPMAGTVVVLSAREGETLNANQTTPTIVQLAKLDIMTVRAQVTEADITRITPGMPVYFTTLGSQGRRWDATVRQVLPTPEIINDVVLYNVLADVNNEDRQLMTGMSTQMFFVHSKADDVPVIPVPALSKRMEAQDSAQGEAYQVQVQSGHTVEDRIIHIGIADRVNAEIKAGLSEGDTILLPAALTSGMNSAPASGTPSRGGMRGMRGMARL